MVSIEEFLNLRQDRPVIDVRSQGEFADGHIPGAVNIPVLDDAERAIVGTTYKKKGQQQAIMEGFRLVGPRLAEMINQTEQLAAGRDVLVHCWRGGMRSSNFCQFIGMAKIRSQSLEGGYKAYRQLALASFQKALPFVVIGGCTGSGKSEILRSLAARGEQILDLEALAQHKGSVFGGLLMPPQPTTEQFQNNLFEAIHNLDVSRRIWVEDESLAIGKIFLPESLWLNMRKSPLVQMDVPKEIRVRRLVEEYGPADRSLFLDAMGKIVKRLGGQHYKTARECLLTDDMAAAIDILLTYYDKSYLGNIEKRKHLVAAVVKWDGSDSDDCAKQLSEEVLSTGQVSN